MSGLRSAVGGSVARTGVATAIAYGVILILMTAILFGGPYLLFRVF